MSPGTAQAVKVAVMKSMEPPNLHLGRKQRKPLTGAENKRPTHQSPERLVPAGESPSPSFKVNECLFNKDVFFLSLKEKVYKIRTRMKSVFTETRRDLRSPKTTVLILIRLSTKFLRERRHELRPACKTPCA